MPQTIWIARHGNRIDFVNPEWFNTAERRYDPHLSEDGVVQAQELATRLAKEPIEHIFVSPFLRTVQTAHKIANVLHLPLKLEPGLSEWLNPEWMDAMPERLPPTQLAQRYPIIDLNYQPCLEPTYPETRDEMIERAGETARRIVKRYDGNLLFVGHGASVVSSAWGLLSDRPKIHASLCCLVQVNHTQHGWDLKLDGSDVSYLSHPQQKIRLV